MKIERAIEIKLHFQYKLQDAFLPELIEADNLSIEALKREQRCRVKGSPSIYSLLPGETKD